MSLLSDPDFLIHSLRLNYLHNVDDPYGPRLIAFHPSFSSNEYIVAASLADPDRWPELAAPSSPPLSQDEADPARPRSISGFPGATGLKYSQTILGPSRTGAVGMGVHGRRRSDNRRSAKRASLIAAARSAESAPQIQANAQSPAPASVLSQPKIQMHSEPPSVKEHEEPEPRQSQSSADTVPSQPAPFIPKFKGAAEMDARRRLRILARHGGPEAAKPSTTPEKPASSDFSSSDEEGSASPVEDDEEEEDFIDLDVDDSMEMEGDEFDPEFATTRIPSDSTSDVLSLSLLSGNSALSTSNSSLIASSLQYPASSRTRPRLSPVNEGGVPSKDTGASSSTSTPQRPSRPIDSYFEMVTPPPPKSATVETPPPAAKPPKPKPEAEDLFARQPVAAAHTGKSALSALLATSNTSNPFSDLYSAISGRGDAAGSAITTSVYFPHARKPAGKAMALSVRRDATVEEVLGFALWSYWEEGWEPRLDEIADGREEMLSAVGWVMRIAEEDGEVDEDFPPPDRTGKIAKFNFDAYAVLEASAAQIQQNKILESKIQRSPSRVVAKAKKPEPAAGLTVPGTATVGGSMPGTSAVLSSTLVNSMFSSSFGPSPNYGPQMFLRIRVLDTADAVHISTTIPVSATMYMQEALELVCRKRKLQDPKEYALLLGDMSILIPLDRTVASLQGKSDLMLVKRSMLPHLGVDVGKPTGRTTDPNASIFKRMSDVPDTQYSAAGDYTAAYKKYTVFRKMPMLVGRHERVLAIDGAYIHIMPSANKAKAVFDSGKTASYHIKSVVACQQSTKMSSTFRFVVHRDGGNKRYDFEAESARAANEIVQTIRGMKTSLERSGTVHKSRRSKHVE
ncbi:hypothetical protein DENSPDRAFT_830640 [Dentipellis sp. KUC8613]|nr:hypothetical protein DENSPDRAFT_830640 [Dentipellis sp. KUC8613]